MFYVCDRSVKRSCRSVHMPVGIFNYTRGQKQTITETDTNHHTPDHHLSAVCLPFFLDEEQPIVHNSFLRVIREATPMQTLISSIEKRASVSNPMPLPVCTYRSRQSPKETLLCANVNGDVNAYGMYMGVSALYGFHEIHRIHAFHLQNFLIAFFQHL